jgi:GT2 family glycosyltransferase
LLPTLRADDELIVFDNASVDGSAEIARAHGVKVVRSEENVGFGGANNRAAALAVGRYLVFLNQDTEVETGWLDALLAPLSEVPGLTTAKLLLADRPGRIDTCGNAVHLSGITVCRGYGQPADAFVRQERIAAVSGAAFAIDRASFDLLGGFDERFFLYLEDTDLSLRAALAGLPLWFVPDSRVHHRHVATFGARKLYWLERNRWLLLLKLWTTRSLIGLLPHLVLMELLVWCYALIRGPEAVRAKASAYGWIADHAWTVLHARWSTGRLRRLPDHEVLRRCVWRLDLTELIGSRMLRRFVDAALIGPMWLARAWLRAAG